MAPLRLPRAPQCVHTLHDALFDHANIAVTLCLFFQTLLSQISFPALFLAGIFGAILIWWCQSRTYSDPMVFLIVFLSTFLSLLGVAHPSLSFFTRFVVYFSYTDLNFSVIHSGRRRYFVGCAIPLVVVLEPLPLTAVLCVAGIGFVSLFVSISFPSAEVPQSRAEYARPCAVSAVRTREPDSPLAPRRFPRARLPGQPVRGAGAEVHARDDRVRCRHVRFGIL
jgi:hypothetical protein